MLFNTSAYFRRGRHRQRTSGGLVGIASILAILSANSLAATPARAAVQPAQERVAHRDLDLSNPGDVLILERRIASAAGRVCRKTYDGAMLSQRQACQAATIAAAASQVDRALAMARLESVQLAQVR